MRIVPIVIMLMALGSLCFDVESVEHQPKTPQVDRHQNATKAVNNQNTSSKLAQTPRQNALMPNLLYGPPKGNLHTSEEAINDKNEVHKWYDMLLVFFTGVLALYTIRLSRSTEKLWKAGEKQMKLTRDSLNLAQEEFIASHRPQLRVRNVVVRAPTGSNLPVPQSVLGQFYVDNIGDSTAQITEYMARIFLTQDDVLPMERPYEGENGTVLPNTTIEHGSSKPFTLGSSMAWAECRDIMTGANTTRLYVIGWIEYVDRLNVKRRIAFCPKYSISKGCFVVVDNPDYEHEN